MKLKPFEYIIDAGTPRERVVCTCCVEDRLDRLKKMTIPELQAIITDQEIQLTVRKAAERTLRKLRKLASVPAQPSTINHQP